MSYFGWVLATRNRMSEIDRNRVFEDVAAGVADIGQVTGVNLVVPILILRGLPVCDAPGAESAHAVALHIVDESDAGILRLSHEVGYLHDDGVLLVVECDELLYRAEFLDAEHIERAGVVDEDGAMIERDVEAVLDGVEVVARARPLLGEVECRLAHVVVAVGLVAESLLAPLDKTVLGVGQDPVEFSLFHSGKF